LRRQRRTRLVEPRFSVRWRPWKQLQPAEIQILLEALLLRLLLLPLEPPDVVELEVRLSLRRKAISRQPVVSSGTKMNKTLLERSLLVV
jgi:hypothetical protein